MRATSEKNNPGPNKNGRQIHWQMYLLIVLVGLTITSIMGYGFFKGTRMTETYAPLVDAAMEIKLEATTAHLWFEEIMSGDRYEDINMVWQHQDQAEWYAQAMLDGGENLEGTFIPLEDIEMRVKINNVQKKLLEFRKITQQRLDIQRLSGVGTDIDQRYDRIYQDFLQEADEVETKLQQLMTADLRHFRFIQIFLLGATILLFLSIGVAFYRSERNKEQSFQTLVRAKAELEREVFERKRTEEALRASEEWLRTILETLDNVAFITTDLNGEETRIGTFSTGAEKMFGYKASEIIGKKVAVLHLPDAAADFQEIQHFLNSSAKGSFEEATLVRKSGDTFTALFTLHPLFDSVGAIHGTLGVTFDITERKEAEVELTNYREKLEELVEQRTKELTDKTNKIMESRKALTYLLEDVSEAREELQKVNNDYLVVNQELKEFAYIVSHDLKAPLRAISQLTHWISEDYSQAFDNEGQKQMGLILQRVKRMDGLIDGILEYSRVGRIRVKTVQLNLHVLVQDIIEILAPPETIKVSIANKLPMIEGDPTRMEQIFQNLINNAIKFMNKDHGIVTVDCVDDGLFWKFSVADNGPGIEKRYFEKIFQIFQTLTSRDEHESTGIGLTLVKKIVTLYGGKIWLESEKDLGTTFFFTLTKKGEQDEKL